MRGARAVRESIIQGFPNRTLNLGIVWINMLPDDSEEIAIRSAGELADRRVCHFYDPNKRSGRAIAESIGWEGRVAWDIYLFYRPDSEWGGAPPAPTDWMHQMIDTWADRELYRRGEDLRRGLIKSLKTLLADGCVE